MSDSLKPHKTHRHVFAILRYEADAGETVPIDLRITVKRVVGDPDYAEREVRRLNELNKDKGSYYFCQVTRFEDTPAEVQSSPPRQWNSAEEARA